MFNKMSYEKFQQWTIDFTEIFTKDICEFLGIDTRPYITLMNEYILGKKGIYGVFMVNDFKYLGFHEVKTKTVPLYEHEELAPSVAIAVEAIYKSCNTSFSMKMAFIHTLVHEMTHYEQCLSGRFDGYVAKSYLTSLQEKDANDFADRYKLQNILKLAAYMLLA